MLAVAAIGCLLVADLLGQVLALWQKRPPSVRWLNAGAAGQGVLAVAAIYVLVADVTRPGSRRGTVLAEVLIVLVAFGWFFLTAWLRRRALPQSGCRHRIPPVCSACFMIDIEMPIPNGRYLRATGRSSASHGV